MKERGRRMALLTFCNIIQAKRIKILLLKSDIHTCY